MTMKSLVAAIALAAAIAPPAMAQKPVPFRGTYEASENSGGGAFPVFTQVLGGSGEATHLGRFTIEAVWHVNVLTLGAVGTFTLTAADGATVTGSATATAVVVDGVAYITETCAITEGTGRLADATGTFVAARVLTVATGSTEYSTASFQGTIQLR